MRSGGAARPIWMRRFFDGNDWGLVTGDCGLSRIVIPSAAEGSLLHCENQRVCTEGKRCPGAASHQAMSVLQ